MKIINSFFWMKSLFKEFVSEVKSNSTLEIVNIFECPKTGFIKAVIKLASRHTIEKNISDIMMDNNLVEGLDKKTIRTLMYMATVEKMKPDCSIVVQQLGNEIDEYILQIKSKENVLTYKTPSELSKDKSFISRFHAIDANRIGYLAGVRETIKDFQMKQSTSKEKL